MAFRRLSMRKIHTTLRLFFEAGLSIRATARTLGVSPSTAGDYIRRAKGASMRVDEHRDSWGGSGQGIGKPMGTRPATRRTERGKRR